MTTQTPHPAGHTPGPWGYRKHLPSTFVTNDPFRKAMQDAWYIHGPKNTSDFVADIFVEKGNQSEANAALISAAPDLLAACEAVLQTVTAHAERYPGDREAQAEAAALTAAISKARGQA